MSDLPGFLDFTKPGHGVVDDSYYHPFVRFWKRYGRNFSKLFVLNLIYAILTMPVYVWLTGLLNATAAEANEGIVSLLGSFLLYYAVKLPGPVLAAVLILSFLILGPATAALTYSAMDCAWDRPGLFWDGFRGAFKGNWKQALPAGLLDVLVCFVSVYYLVDTSGAFGFFGGIMKVLWVLLLVIYGMIRVYLYPIMVTMELPFGALVRNCLILSLLKLWRPLLVLLITAAFIFLCVFMDMLLVPCFMYSFIAFTAAFLVQPVMDQYLLHPQQTEETEAE